MENSRSCVDAKTFTSAGYGGNTYWGLGGSEGHRQIASNLWGEFVLFLISCISVLYLSEAYDSTPSATTLAKKKERDTEESPKTLPKVYSRTPSQYHMHTNKLPNISPGASFPYLFPNTTPFFTLPTPMFSKKFTTASTNL